MNASEIINSSQISQLPIADSDQSLDGSRTFSDIKASVARAIDTIDNALPQMKAAGVDLKKASVDAEGLFRNVVRKGWGGNQVEFFITRNGQKAITAVTARHIDDIAESVSEFVANF